MVEQGALADPKPGAIFGLHVTSRTKTGTLAYRPGGTMASADGLRIVVKGRQTHGAMPWLGVDPVTTAGHILVALQSVAARRIDITQSPVVISIGAIHGGVRSNIIPDHVTMEGTIRALDPQIRTQLHDKIKETVDEGRREHGGQGRGDDRPRSAGHLQRSRAHTAHGADPRARRRPPAGPVSPPTTGAEDFSIFQQQIPGLFFFMGVTPADRDLEKAAPNHSPHFYIDESGLVLGVRAMTNLAWDYLTATSTE